MTRRAASVWPRTLVLLALCAILGASPAGAQRVNGAQAQAGAPPQGPALERQFRERFAEVVKRRLNLDDTQMQQLGRVNDRFERDRMMLQMSRQLTETIPPKYASQFAPRGDAPPAEVREIKNEPADLEFDLKSK